MARVVSIAGNWLDGDGYLRDSAPRFLNVLIVDGKAYHAEAFYGVPPELRTPLSADEDGHIRGFSGGSFVADAGEIKRVGRAVFIDG